jgi:hypothetical protein
MDTTSHAFTWQTFTFGGAAGSCVLNGVAIINDSLAYAVGAVYLNDSLGNPDPNAYNLLKWDGHQWTLMRIQFLGFCNQSATGSFPTTAICAFNSQDVWIAMNNEVARWYGTFQGPVKCLSFNVNKFWGEDTNMMYAVGNNGGIIRDSAEYWQDVPCGTTLPFRDVYGSKDPQSGKEQILAVCTQDDPPTRGIYSIRGTTATEVSSTIPGNPIAGLYGVWFVPSQHYYIVGDGIYEKTNLADSVWHNQPLVYTKYGTTKIGGNGLNDIFIVGAFGECLHWNGASWRSYITQIGLSDGAYAGLSIIKNMVIAVGANGPQAVIAIGRR